MTQKIPEIVAPVVELTGRMGCGKTLAAKAFQAIRIDVVDADKVARAVVMPGTPAFEEIIALWPEVETDQGINRDKLRELTFGARDKEAIAELESITHPRIESETIRRLSESAGLYVVHERPALARPSTIKPFYRLMIDQPNPSVEISRIIDRGIISRQYITKDQVNEMLSHQYSREELLSISNGRILNNGTKREVADKVKAWDRRFRSELRGVKRQKPASSSAG